jgi:1,4-dihydroxy-2-naphthoate octaprenyltransferase
MVSVKQYLVYARAPFLTASVVPVVLGSAIAYRFEHAFKLLDFTFALLGMIFAHLGVNLANDYYDYLQGADRDNRFRNPFSGGSPHLVEGKEKPALIKALAWLSFLAAGACGLLLMIRVDRGIGPIFWLAVAGFISGYFYTAPPLKFAYRGFGEFFILVSFGMLPVLGAYYVQSGKLSWPPVFAGVVVGLLTTNILWINQFPDYQSDRDAGKATLVVRLGTARARFLYLVFLAVAALFIALGPVWWNFSPYYLAGLVALAPAVVASRILMRYHSDPANLLKGQALTIVAQLVTGVALTIGVLL